jgi:hypothetical protein
MCISAAEFCHISPVFVYLGADTPARTAVIGVSFDINTGIAASLFRRIARDDGYRAQGDVRPDRDIFLDHRWYCSHHRAFHNRHLAGGRAHKVRAEPEFGNKDCCNDDHADDDHNVQGTEFRKAAWSSVRRSLFFTHDMLLSSHEISRLLNHIPEFKNDQNVFNPVTGFLQKRSAPGRACIFSRIPRNEII